MSTTVDDLIEVKDCAVGVCYSVREVVNEILQSNDLSVEHRGKLTVLHAQAFEACRYADDYDAAEEDSDCYDISDYWEKVGRGTS